MRGGAGVAQLAIQRCGIGSSCDCPARDKLTGIEHDLQRATAAGGMPLPATSQERMESAFSSDFAAVRVHTGAAAHHAASSLGARALTAGADILFRAGEYSPGTPGGDRLLAHELAHVVQQAHGLSQTILDTGATDHLETAAGLAADHASPAAEREAHDAAMIAAIGEPVPVLSRQPPTIAHQDDSEDPAASNYQLGYNDGLACNPPSPEPLPPEYYQGYQDGQAAAEAAQACLPEASTYAQVNPPGTAPMDYSAMDTIPIDAVAYDNYGGWDSSLMSSSISQACDILGLPYANWVSGYRVLISREGPAGPNSVNDWDVNATGRIMPDGHKKNCSRGLTQVIPSTFATYHVAGTSAEIYDPIANIAASMRYVMHVYGVSADGSNLASNVQQADPSRSPKGY
jgi:hypothetical protein